MADPADRLSELKIDRSAYQPAGRAWLWPVLGIAFIAIAIITWYLLDRTGGAIDVETEIARRPPSAAAANSVLDASGYVTARREATVSSEVTGKVTEVLIEEGMSVEAGQIVARLDDTTQRAQVALSKAQLQSARAAIAEVEAQLRAARLERDRLRELVARKLTSTSSVDTAEASFDALAARLAAARDNVTVSEKSLALAQDALDDMTIHAPFGGMVVSKNAQPGEMISPISAGGGFTRTGICTIVDMDSLEIEVDVNEAYIQRVKPGQAVSATLDAYPNWQIPADVIAIVPTADRQKATVRVRIGFRERDERILRDMGVKVAFLGSESPPTDSKDPQGVMVSSSAIQEDADGPYVWRVSNNRVERRAVVLGSAADRDRVLVLDGLQTGDTIVRSADAPLRAGQDVITK
ncbi:MAG TPA: efflux RND transporter periplasmic adaptor subunit [Woeseiaceae bacterium]|nr:efflux RND transporter periplasmic adaptor subunit [Woeseiaceae bacterium]